MAKDKNKDAKKDRKSNDLLDEAARRLKKFRKVTKHMTKLSTAQKLVGGVALLAAGLTYLAKRQADEEAATVPGANAAEATLATLVNANGTNTKRPPTGEAAEATGGAGVPRKSKRAHKSK